MGFKMLFNFSFSFSLFMKIWIKCLNVSKQVFVAISYMNSRLQVIGIKHESQYKITSLQSINNWSQMGFLMCQYCVRSVSLHNNNMKQRQYQKKLCLCLPLTLWLSLDTQIVKVYEGGHIRPSKSYGPILWRKQPQYSANKTNYICIQTHNGKTLSSQVPSVIIGEKELDI